MEEERPFEWKCNKYVKRKQLKKSFNIPSSYICISITLLKLELWTRDDLHLNKSIFNFSSTKMELEHEMICSLHKINLKLANVLLLLIPKKCFAKPISGI